MPLLPIALPPGWDIPVAAGVPALLGQSATDGVRASASTIFATALEDYTINKNAKEWGIFSQDGTAVFTSAHVRAADIQKAYDLPISPQENGGFTNYNKTAFPGMYSVEFLCDGSTFEYGNASAFTDLLSDIGLSSAYSAAKQAKTLFVEALDKIAADLNLYIVRTPYITFMNANIRGYDIRHEVRRGASMIYADVMLQEVRMSARHNITTTKEASGEAQQNGGNVQTQDLSNAQASALADFQVSAMANNAGIHW